MTTLTYCKGLPTPIDELTYLGLTDFELFLFDYSAIAYKAAIETVNHLLCLQGKFDKSKWNTHLQQTYGISKRHAGGIIAHTIGKVASAKECRIDHIKTIESKLKSALEWVNKAKKKVKLAQKFYAKKDWQHAKTGCIFPLSTSLETKKTNWHQLKFTIHHKQRYIHKLELSLKCLKTAQIRVKLSHGEVFVVGSKDESYGNQVCQWDGKVIKFRVPYALESKYGKYVESKIGHFDRNINRLPELGAKTWHFYRKDYRWVVAVQFTPASVERVSRPIQYGCIGIDLNPGSIGWAYVDLEGNLQASGRIFVQTGLPNGKQDAQIVDACLQLAILASCFACPIVCENLDFTGKKSQLREKGRRYARMLSQWAYSRFYQLLESILSNRGISLFKRNPAYTSLIGLVKYARMYGLSSDIAAAIAIARRGMNLSERLPRSMSAYLGVNPRKHVWSALHQLNKFVGQCVVVNRRHDYYSVSNWEPLVKVYAEQVARSSERRAFAKRKR
jgi:IS605 OrfB family transposase